MSVLHVSAPDDVGRRLVITDDACRACGWPDTRIIVEADGTSRAGCAGCELDRESGGSEND